MATNTYEAVADILWNINHIESAHWGTSTGIKWYKGNDKD
jgi:hypothetical protein